MRLTSDNPINQLYNYFAILLVHFRSRIWQIAWRIDEEYTKHLIFIANAPEKQMLNLIYWKSVCKAYLQVSASLNFYFTI